MRAKSNINTFKFRRWIQLQVLWETASYCFISEGGRFTLVPMVDDSEDLVRRGDNQLPFH